MKNPISLVTVSHTVWTYEQTKHSRNNKIKPENVAMIAFQARHREKRKTGKIPTESRWHVVQQWSVFDTCNHSARKGVQKNIWGPEAHFSLNLMETSHSHLERKASPGLMWNDETGRRTIAARVEAHACSQGAESVPVGQNGRMEELTPDPKIKTARPEGVSFLCLLKIDERKSFFMEKSQLWLRNKGRIRDAPLRNSQSQWTSPMIMNDSFPTHSVMAVETG